MVWQTLKNKIYSQESFFFAVPALVWQSILCVVPLIYIIMNSVYRNSQFSFDRYVTLLSYPYFYIIGRSLLLATLTSGIALLLGYPLAYWLALRVKRCKNILLFLIVVPFWTNLLVLIYSWIFILEPIGVVNTFLLYVGIISQPLSLLNSVSAVCLVAVYCYLPFMVLPLVTVLEKIDKSILEASYDLGATQWQTFFKIIVPISWSGIRTGLLLVFVPVFGEYTIPLLMGGDKYMFVGNAISHFVFVAHDLPTAAAFTLLATIGLLGSIFVITRTMKYIIYTL